MGWLTSESWPRWPRAAFSTRSITSALVATPAGHWSCGFRITKASETFGGIGSVATSAVPVLENMSSTSGSFLTASSTLRCIARDCSRLTEGTRVEASARFFSSSWGMNSEPRRPNAGIAAKKKARPPRMNGHGRASALRSEEHTSELQSLMRISYAVFYLKNKNETPHIQQLHISLIHHRREQ